jgi:hypothetical protein
MESDLEQALSQLVPPEHLDGAGSGSRAGQPTRAELRALAAELPTPELWAHASDVDSELARRRGS